MSKVQPQAVSTPEAKAAPELPKPLPGKYQGRLSLADILKHRERGEARKMDFFKPETLKLAKEPVIETETPSFVKKPGFAERFAQFTFKRKKKDPKAIYAKRHVKNTNEFPWCTVGKIFVGKNLNFASYHTVGTGVLVGENLVLTASNIAPWGEAGWWMRFVPAYREGEEPFGSSYVQDIFGFKETPERGDDFVVCKLFEPIGKKCGWMGTQGWIEDKPYVKHYWDSLGYPAGRMVVNEKIVIEAVKTQNEAKLLEMEYFAYAGWTGAPVWHWEDDCDEPTVVGVLLGTEHLPGFYDEVTLGAGGIELVELVWWALERFKS
jgi:V8-like Glu-specific endopeptidase